MKEKILVEVCCGSVDDALEAQRGGADRVELNTSLMYGGLTPSAGSIIEAKRRLAIPVMVMIRPRGGGFCYTDVEMGVMEQDVQMALQCGADGIVFGILKEDGTIDEERCRRIIGLAQGKDAVFHRAFDVVPDPFRALEQLIALGVKRILTMGQQNSLFEGAALVKKLIGRAAGRIEILPGGWQTYQMSEMIRDIGCDQIHIASYIEKKDPSALARPHVYFGAALRPPEDRYELVDCEYVKMMRAKTEGPLE